MTFSSLTADGAVTARRLRQELSPLLFEKEALHGPLVLRLSDPALRGGRIRARESANPARRPRVSCRAPRRRGRRREDVRLPEERDLWRLLRPEALPLQPESVRVSSALLRI